MENFQICLLSAGFLITRTGWHMSSTHQHGKLKSHQPFSLLKMSYQPQKAAMLCARLACKTQMPDEIFLFSVQSLHGFNRMDYPTCAFQHCYHYLITLYHDKRQWKYRFQLGKNAIITTSFVLPVLQNVSFTSPFYSPPAILTTVRNGGKNSTNVVCPVKLGPLSSWVEVYHSFTNCYF